MRTRKSLTKKQREVLDFIDNFLDERGFAPSYQEIAREFRFASPSTASFHVHALRKKEYLSLDEGGQRSMQVIRSINSLVPNAAIRELPLVGLITAGEPIEAIEERESISIPASMAPDENKSYFGLRVKGESMIEDGILDGDFIIAEKQDHARNGDIVVALLENKYATLKRFYKEKDHIRLQPANSLMEPIRVRDVTIQGKLVGLIRKYHTA